MEFQPKLVQLPVAHAWWAAVLTFDPINFRADTCLRGYVICATFLPRSSTSQEEPGRPRWVADVWVTETSHPQAHNHWTPCLFFQVCTEGRLILEFTFDDLMRIKTWHFTIRQYRELVPRSILAMHVSTLISISLSSLSSHLTQKREALFAHCETAPRNFTL